MLDLLVDDLVFPDLVIDELVCDMIHYFVGELINCSFH